MYKRTKNHGSGPFSRELSYPPFSSMKISFVSTMVGIFTITTSKNEGGDAKNMFGEERCSKADEVQVCDGAKNMKTANH